MSYMSIIVNIFLLDGLSQRGENFQFDQEQRLSRELLRQILQLKRFTLFREELGCAVAHSSGTDLPF